MLRVKQNNPIIIGLKGVARILTSFHNSTPPPPPQTKKQPQKKTSLICSYPNFRSKQTNKPVIHISKNSPTGPTERTPKPEYLIGPNTQTKHTNLLLVGGWTNPSEKNISRIGSSSPIFGVKIKKYLKPPPSYDISSSESLPIHGWFIFMKGKYTPQNWLHTNHPFLHTYPPSPTDCSSIDCLTYHWIVVPPHWVDRCVSEDRRQDHDLKQPEVTKSELPGVGLKEMAVGWDDCPSKKTVTTRMTWCF